jgi:hypothetical protein
MLAGILFDEIDKTSWKKIFNPVPNERLSSQEMFKLSVNLFKNKVPWLENINPIGFHKDANKATQTYWFFWEKDQLISILLLETNFSADKKSPCLTLTEINGANPQDLCEIVEEFYSYNLDSKGLIKKIQRIYKENNFKQALKT